MKPILKQILNKFITKLYTLGQENVTWVVGYEVISGGSGSNSKELGNLYLTCTYATATVTETYVTDVPVDLTRVKKVRIDWENTGSNSTSNLSRFNISTSKTGSSSVYDAQLSKTKLFARTTEFVDVSNQIGNYYIRVHAAETTIAGTATIKIYRVWLEY